MPIPTLYDLTLPLLRVAVADTSFAEAIGKLADEFELTPNERSEMLPSGSETRFSNRVRWAKVELGMAGLVENTKPKHFRATEAGLAVLAKGPPRLDPSFLMTLPVYRAKKERSREQASDTLQARSPVEEKPSEAEASPQETLDRAVQRLEEGLASDLLDRLTRGSPAFFERAVIELLLAMGYGGSRADAGKHLGRSGDGGIDGVINQDPLGLDGIYIQAKRYGSNTGSIGEPQIRDFVGSLVGRSASKGVFVTTGTFSPSARTYVRTIPHRLVLIDGPELARLMVAHNVGVRTGRTVSIKAINAEFFDDR